MIWMITAVFASGVQIEEKNPCTGSEYPPGTVLTLRYQGSVAGQEPFVNTLNASADSFTLGVGQLIKGWEEGLQGMSPGCTRVLTIPPELGYGAQGRPPVIPENATLVFEISLEKVNTERALPEPTEVTYTSLPSGLKVADLVVGDGESPARGQRATVEYGLWLVDGTLVDSSVKRPHPFTYRVQAGEVIPGWEEAVLGMKVGGTRQFLVPFTLGYGVAGRPPVIPRKSALVFVVKLIALR